MEEEIKDLKERLRAQTAKCKMWMDRANHAERQLQELDEALRTLARYMPVQLLEED